jgi:hypothetical protein
MPCNCFEQRVGGCFVVGNREEFNVNRNRRSDPNAGLCRTIIINTVPAEVLATSSSTSPENGHRIRCERVGFCSNQSRS